MMFALSQAASWLGVASVPEWSTIIVKRVVTDSRAIQAGDLFIALVGDRFDGHDFVAQALRDGAVAAVVAHPVADCTGPLLQVDDTLLALGQLGCSWREQFSCPVVAITGSNGKTSVKEMVAAILRAACADDAAVLATHGNLNNEIGVPLTLLSLRPHHRFAVIEMGMNHRGEIARLTQLAQPSVALVNNAMRAHLGHFSDVSEAIEELNRAVIIDPGNVKAVSNLAVCYFYMSDYSKAYHYYIMAKKMDSDYVKSRFTREKIKDKTEKIENRGYNEKEINKIIDKVTEE